MSGPIQVLLAQEEENKRWLRDRRACSTSAPAPAKRRSNQFDGLIKQEDPDGLSYARPTILSAVRKSQVMGEELALDSSSTSGTTPRLENDRPGSEVWAEFHQRTATFLDERGKLLEHLRNQKAEAELQGCTFEPQMFTASRGDSEGKARSNSLASDAMYTRSRLQLERKAERLERMRQQFADREMGECSFRPDTKLARGGKTARAMSARLNNRSAPALEIKRAEPDRDWCSAAAASARAAGSFVWSAPPRVSHEGLHSELKGLSLALDPSGTPREPLPRSKTRGGRQSGRQIGAHHYYQQGLASSP